QAYAKGEVEVEHWSILTYLQRLEAAARGLPAAVTGSLRGSSMATNDAFTEVETPFGAVGLVAPLVPDVALVHGVAADRQGNIAVNPPLLEGVWGALAARRGAVVTVERVVDDLKRLGTDRIDWLRARTDPESWRDDAAAWPVDEGAPVGGWETAAAWGARELQTRIAAVGADAVLAGAGVANLAAWVGVAGARAAGSRVVLTAELGLGGYTPTPADPS